MNKFINKKTGAIVNVPAAYERQYIKSSLWEEYKEVKEKATTAVESKKS